MYIFKSYGVHINRITVKSPPIEAVFLYVQNCLLCYIVRTRLYCFLGVRTVHNKKKANETTTSVRKDMRIDKELLAKIEEVRGDVPFAAWVKRAIKMRLDGLETKPVESIPVSISADKKIKKKTKAPTKTTSVRTPNELRAEKTKQLLFSAVSSLSSTKKSEIINARYPKNECRKAIGEIVSKDSIAKYWNEIEVILKK